MSCDDDKCTLWASSARVQGWARSVRMSRIACLTSLRHAEDCGVERSLVLCVSVQAGRPAPFRGRAAPAERIGSEVGGVGGADAEAVSVGVGGDEGVAELQGGRFQRDGEAECCPVAVELVDVVVGGVAHG